MINTYAHDIQFTHQKLGITKDYANITGLVLQTEATDLHTIEKDIYGRPQRILRAACKPWSQMQTRAAQEGIVLAVVSGFRSVQRQTEIIQGKIDKGEKIDDILKILAAPGYSEHHTGRALDLTTSDSKTLEQEFEQTAAFAWLQKNAAIFSFYLSDPIKNKHGIAYEPWHWAYADA